jgi:hypothetical protein
MLRHQASAGEMGLPAAARAGLAQRVDDAQNDLRSTACFLACIAKGITGARDLKRSVRAWSSVENVTAHKYFRRGWDMNKFVILGLAGACLGGCASSQTTSLAPNIAHIDASGYVTNQTAPTTMRDAAKTTLQAGYTHFRISDASGVGGEPANTACSGTSSWNGSWNGSDGNAAGSGGGGCAPVFRLTSKASVTVTMFRSGDTGAAGAFDAQQVLRQYGG